MVRVRSIPSFKLKIDFHPSSFNLMEDKTACEIGDCCCCSIWLGRTILHWTELNWAIVSASSFIEVASSGAIL